MKKPNKHTEMGPATLKRLAKEFRKEAAKFPRGTPDADRWRRQAQIFDAEAKLLRAMR